MSKDLRSRLVARVHQLRSSARDGRHDEPRFVAFDLYRFGDSVHRRLRVVLRGNGCSVPTCTMCPLPNASLDAKLTQVTTEDYVRQVRRSLHSKPEADMVCIYNDGSFFAPAELPLDAQRSICQLVSESHCRLLMVESLPQFVTAERLAEAKQALRGTELIVALGVQSVNRDVRELCIGSPVRLPAITRALERLRQLAVGRKAYVMFKPPFLGDTEAIQDTIASVQWLVDHDVQDITLCPTRIADGTVAAELSAMGLYTPPRLGALLECLRTLRDCGMIVRVSTINVHSPDLVATTSGGCPKCTRRITCALDRYNLDPWNAQLDGLVCVDCIEMKEHEPFPGFLDRSLAGRVAHYLRMISSTKGRASCATEKCATIPS